MLNDYPPLKFHTHSGQYRAWLKGRYHYFGKHAPTAERAYLAALLNGEAKGPIVASVVSSVLEWAKTAYKPTPCGGEAKTMKYALAFLDCEVSVFLPQTGEQTVYLPQIPADSFTVIHLAAVQKRMIELGKARTYINGTIKRIVRAFEQARIMGMVSRETVSDLQTIRHIRQGHPTVHETGRVVSVDSETVDTTLALIHSAPVLAILTVLRLSGMRIGECCPMRLDQLKADGDGLLYDLGLNHKTAMRKYRKTIRLCAGCKAVLAPFIEAARATMNTRAFLWPSDRSKAGHIMPGTVGWWIDEACAKGKIARWTPHQLRHSVATEAARIEAGAMRAAAAKLQHKSVSTARVYVDPGAAG